jgi:signal transduction histidine kinase
LWLLVSVCAVATDGDDASAVVTLTHAEAVSAGWDSPAPPVSGWIPVDLPDSWKDHFPQHEGVVWYRLHWQAEPGKPVALMLRYRVAAAIYANGSLVGRDPSLVEPLSRSFIAPKYFLLDAPLLRPGDNELLVRVSALAAYEGSGLYPVTVGNPGKVYRLYKGNLFRRLHARLITVSVALALGMISLLMWLLRRRETMFGWFAVYALFALLDQSVLIFEDPWPFASFDAENAFGETAGLLASAAWMMFLLRFGERRYPRLEWTFWLACLALAVCAFVAPEWTGRHQDDWQFVRFSSRFALVVWLWARALRTPRLDYWVLAVCLVLPATSELLAIAQNFGWGFVPPLLVQASVLKFVGIMFALAYRFVAQARRVENFNVELRHEVAVATQRLGDTLKREHDLALAKSHADERLQMTRDLHDGFGGTLVGAIARLEHAPDDMPKSKVVDVLKQMRDDLRLVIDSTTAEHTHLEDLLAPLRHRSSQLLETASIDSNWHLQGTENLEFDHARGLQLLRLLQEALTNIFKHSNATSVDVYLERDDGQLRLRVRDNGKGLPAGAGQKPTASGGAGLASMRIRAHRLGGTLKVDSSAGGTQLEVMFPA